MIEDDEGALWIGAEEGLFRFDGIRFQQIDIGLDKKNHVIRSLAKSEDGSIWGSSMAGLFRVHPHTGSQKVTIERPSWGTVDIRGQYVALIEGDGNGGRLALGVYRDGILKMTRYDGIHYDGPPKFDNVGNLLTGCGDDICEISAHEVQNAIQGNAPKIVRHPLPLKKTGRRSVMRDQSGCIWFRNTSRAGYKCPPSNQFQLIPLDVAEVSEFTNLMLDAEGRVWMVSDSGMLSYGKAGTFRSLTAKNGMPRSMQVVYRTRDGSTWVGGYSSLWRFIDPERLEVWMERDGISLTATALVRNGSNVLLGGSSGLLKLNSDRARWEPFSDQREMRHVRALFPTQIGTTLVSSTFSGVMELDSNGAILRRTTPYVNRFSDAGPHQVWTAGLFTKLMQYGPDGLFFEQGRKAWRFPTDGNSSVTQLVDSGIAPVLDWHDLSQLLNPGGSGLPKMGCFTMFAAP